MPVGRAVGIESPDLGPKFVGRGEAVAQAFVDGASELALYASQAFKDNENALDAECEAVAVSRRVVRPLLPVFGEHTREARAWPEVLGDRIEAGNITHVTEALSFLKPRRAQTRKLIEDLKGYLDNNRDRMKYPEYRRRGLRISSAAVESANFHVTGTRLKLQGMRWSAEGAAQMAVLRADLFNGRWEARTRQLLAA
jgi:hypothetical protein